MTVASLRKILADFHDNTVVMVEPRHGQPSAVDGTHAAHIEKLTRCWDSTQTAVLCLVLAPAGGDVQETLN